MLEYLAKKDLRFKSKKCKFYKRKIKFLNYTIKKNIIHINLIKVKDIKK